MAQGEDIKPIFLPVAPKPATYKPYCLPYLYQPYLCKFTSETHPTRNTDSLFTSVGFYLNVPYYFQTQALLI